MDRGIFLAASSASNLMGRLAVVSQNMANVSTTGFKKIMDRTVSVPVQGGGAPGSGARTYAVTLTPGVDTASGATIETGNALNVALGSGYYLGVADGAGEVFTRRGDLGQDAAGVLRLPDGRAVLSADGGEIAIPAGYAGAVGLDGTVWAQDPANPTNKQEVGRLRVVAGKQVSLAPSGYYLIGDVRAALDGASVLVGGALEQSNVSAAESLAEMIETSRLYDLHAKMMSTFSTVEQQGSGLLANWQ